VESTHRSRHLVQATTAATLGLSERQTDTILRRCREAGGDLTSLLPWHLKWRSGQAPRGTGE